LSSDGAWWFDGATWRAAGANQQDVAATRARRRLTRAEIVVAAVWFVLLILSAVWAAVTVPPAQAEASTLSTAAVASGVALLGIAVLGTIATAAWLASSGRCLVIGLFAIYVSGLFFAWYLAAMLTVPVPVGQPDTQDDLAAVGLIFLAVPTTVVVGFLACLGTGIGATIRALRQRRTSVARSA
jgi:hypothetical protein